MNRWDNYTNISSRSSSAYNITIFKGDPEIIYIEIIHISITISVKSNEIGTGC